jgi:prophage maintenance system killer protein
VTTFLDLNENDCDLPHDAAFDLVMDIASGSLELDEIAQRLAVRPRQPKVKS